MIKRISLVARKPELTHEAFVDHWLGSHVNIVRQMPALRGMKLNVVSPSDGEWDGIGELWFDSREDAEESFQTEPIKSLLAADRATFMARNEVYWAAEHVIIPPATEK